MIGDGPNTVSESTVSNSEVREFLALTEFRGESSVSSFQPICVPKRTHRAFFRELTEFGAELSEFSLPTHCSRNNTLWHTIRLHFFKRCEFQRVIP